MVPLKQTAFSEIDGFAGGVGRLFLLNLADSIELRLVAEADVASFYARLDAIGTRSESGWWLRAVEPVLPACVAVPLSGRERFATVQAVTRNELARADSEAELDNTAPDPRATLSDRLAASLLSSRQSKKKYWLTDERCLAGAASPDDVRDKLGLDWVDDGIVLIQFSLSGKVVAAAGVYRPSALCGGSHRFRARRHDEEAQRGFQRWGRTVNLGFWRHYRRRHARLAGAAESVSNVGPLNAGIAVARLLGRTVRPSRCSSPHDHQQFAVALNEGKAVDPATLYGRLTGGAAAGRP